MGGVTAGLLREGGGVQEVGGATSDSLTGGEMMNTGEEGGTRSRLSTSCAGRGRDKGCGLLRSGEETEVRTLVSLLVGVVSLLVGVVNGDNSNGVGRLRFEVPGILATGLEARDDGKF